MGMPVNLDNGQYFADLRDFRDEALEASNLYGQRRHLGAFSVGTAHAQWNAESGALVDLVDSGLRCGNESVFNNKAGTKLRLEESVGEGGQILTVYEMNLGTSGLIKVHHSMLAKPSKNQLRTFSPRKADSKLGLDIPTNEDLEIIYTELQRGASGRYKT